MLKTKYEIVCKNNIDKYMVIHKTEGYLLWDRDRPITSNISLLDFNTKEQGELYIKNNLLYPENYKIKIKNI